MSGVSRSEEEDIRLALKKQVASLSTALSDPAPPPPRTGPTSPAPTSQQPHRTPPQGRRGSSPHAHAAHPHRHTPTPSQQKPNQIRPDPTRPHRQPSSSQSHPHSLSSHTPPNPHSNNPQGGPSPARSHQPGSQASTPVVPRNPFPYGRLSLHPTVSTPGNSSPGSYTIPRSSQPSTPPGGSGRSTPSSVKGQDQDEGQRGRGTPTSALSGSVTMGELAEQRMQHLIGLNADQQRESDQALELQHKAEGVQKWCEISLGNILKGLEENRDDLIGKLYGFLTTYKSKTAAAEEDSRVRLERIAALKAGEGQARARNEQVARQIKEEQQRIDALEGQVASNFSSFNQKLSDCSQASIASDEKMARLHSLILHERDSRQLAEQQFRELEAKTQLGEETLRRKIKTLNASLAMDPSTPSGTPGPFTSPRILTPSSRSASAYDSWNRDGSGRNLLPSGPETSCEITGGAGLRFDTADHALAGSLGNSFQEHPSASEIEMDAEDIEFQPDPRPDNPQDSQGSW